MQSVFSLSLHFMQSQTLALHYLMYRVTKDEHLNGEISMSKKHWIKLYEKTHAPSFAGYKELDLSSEPIVLRPGQVKVRLTSAV